jgi:hypothetical protein
VAAPLKRQIISPARRFLALGARALLNFRFQSKLTHMEYRGIRYTVRARIEREQWSVTIHPAGVELASKIINGQRDSAELRARSMINKWLEKHPAQN